MIIQRLSMIGIFIASLSCAGVDIESANKHEAGSGGYSSSYYPYVASVGAEVTQQPQEDFWECGTDYITAKGPKGETIIIEIKIPCDPFADIYRGCPAPIQEKQKAPEGRGFY